MKKRFPFYKQLDQSDCGPTCLRMIAKHYGKSYSLEYLREHCYINRTGVSLAGISDGAQAIGLRSLSVKVPFEKLREAPLPAIAYWRQRHFVVVYRIEKDTVWVADPGYGLVKYKKDEFIRGWTNRDRMHGDGEDSVGIMLLLETTPDFFDREVSSDKGVTISYLVEYLRPYKNFMIQLVLGMVIGSVLQLIFPFLTQSIVDRGIQYEDIGFVYLILAGQLMLFFSSTAVGFIRSWILLHVSSRINISLVSDFLAKLMRLPISYFDTRVVGDILQRIGDHSRIESFITGSTLSVLFSAVNFVVFAFLLAYFDMSIFTVFMISAVLYMAWILLFLKKRKELDFKRFDESSSNQSNLVQLITGMQDIKLNSCENEKRWEWERIQAKLFKISVEGLKLSQYQNFGASFISNLKDIFITFLSAKSVIDGNITLGGMLAIQYIVGQANGPLGSLIGFIQNAQDAKISLDRLNEVRQREDEEPFNVKRLKDFPNDRSLTLKNVDFSYGGPSSPLVLKDLSVHIPEGKITALVGASGSGKTTILKLLLKFYAPTKGSIYLGQKKLTNFHSTWWRRNCGTVMQDGFIYSDTIGKNIALGQETIDIDRLWHAIHVANIQDYIENLPMGMETKIGEEGIGLSQGQKQRLLIARAVYKDPMYLFFDEATSALDANNEKVIMENLDRFFQGRTVVVVAHRLSTVKNADNIIVLDGGEVVEEGTHIELTQSRGYYYELVKNQLELGS